MVCLRICAHQCLVLKTLKTAVKEVASNAGISRLRKVIWLSQKKSISKATRLKVYEKYGGRCAYCGSTLELKDMQVDHIQSVYWYNGANDIENYNPACRMCNFYKSTMTIDDFRKQLGKLLLRLEKVFIFRLAVKYGLIQKTDNPIEFYFEKQNKTGKESEKNDD